MIRNLLLTALLLLEAALVILLHLSWIALLRGVRPNKRHQRATQRFVRRINRMAPTTVAYELEAIRLVTAEQDLADSEARGQAQRPLNTPTDQEN